MLTKPKDLACHGGSISNDFGKIPFLREPRKVSPKVNRHRFNKSSVLSKTAANSFNFVLWGKNITSFLYDVSQRK